MTITLPLNWLFWSLILAITPWCVRNLGKRRVRFLSHVPRLLRGHCKHLVSSDLEFDLALRYVQEAFAVLSVKFQPQDMEQARKLLMEEFHKRSGCRDPKLLAVVWAQIEPYADMLTRRKFI